MRVAACISGQGSNLRALLEALPAGAPAEVVLVISDRTAAPGLALATAREIPTFVLENVADGGAWLAELDRLRVELVVLAGFLRLVPADVVARYRGRILNVHPALLPAFGGPGMYGGRVHRAVLASRAAESGATVHLVDEMYDRGEILAQARVPVLADDSPEDLAARVLAVEHRLLPAVVLAAARAGHPVPVSNPMESFRQVEPSR